MSQPDYVIDQMISAKSIAARVEILAKEITSHFKDTEKLIVVGLLRGSFVFIADLAREINLPIEIDFLEASSYGDAMESSKEVKIMKDLVKRIAIMVQKENKLKIDFMVGTMIELPRAAIKAKEIAKYAEFFSFGTNDLTQTTFGISRDDSGKFLNDYLENKIFSIDPFVSIDEGVSDLVEIAVAKGKSQNKKIKLGICGEHGGDPKSISFCAKVGLNYVSCSPYRVPVARLAAAQAELKK